MPHRTTGSMNCIPKSSLDSYVKTNLDRIYEEDDSLFNVTIVKIDNDSLVITVSLVDKDYEISVERNKKNGKL